ncbi:MAG: porin [Flavobacteriales bacterium]|jgi:hypothetical protein|tara:strand:+ start:213 stop:1202 length:990 start_codon:yes stop_codon:yes gene_type:complete
MKKIIIILFVLVSFKTIAQDTNNGKPNFKIFWNYHNDFSKEVKKKSAFELKRVYLGYKHDFNDNISAKVTYDIGSNSAGSAYTAYVKIAQLDWKLNPKVKLSMGLIGNKQFNDQESLWGYRYAYKGFLNEFKFGASADLGFNSEFTVNPKFKINLFVLNGEGYKSIQDDNGHQKMGTSFIYNFSKKLSGKIYMDSQRSENTKSMKNNSIFLGYNSIDFRFGVEYGKIKNARTYKNAEDDHNRDGFSIYGSKKLSNNYELFARYDQISSNILTGESRSWNYDNDGSLLMFGAQYQALKGVKFNLNYRFFNHDNSIINNKSILSLNAEFKI